MRDVQLALSCRSLRCDDSVWNRRNFRRGRRESGSAKCDPEQTLPLCNWCIAQSAAARLLIALDLVVASSG